jgi:N-acetylglutamate synthase-like GNAT family acetyltransferase
MNDQPAEWRRGDYTISTDRRRLDVVAVLELLRETHWSQGLTEAQLERAVAHSVCFGVYRDEAVVGFGRVITDLATYGYLTDVVVAPAHRGRGLGSWLTECMLSHPELQGFRRLALLTRDAEALYARAGFTPGPGSLVYMERRGPRPSYPP